MPQWPLGIVCDSTQFFSVQNMSCSYKGKLSWEATYNEQKQLYDWSSSLHNPFLLEHHPQLISLCDCGELYCFTGASLHITRLISEFVTWWQWEVDEMKEEDVFSLETKKRKGIICEERCKVSTYYLTSSVSMEMCRMCSDSSQYAGDPWCGPLAMTDLPLCTTIKITNK